MFRLETLITPERCLCQHQGASKKRLFETTAAFLAESQPGLEATEVYNNLLARERLGSTALGEGIAIPHCRISKCSEPLGVLITLSDGIDFDAPDSADVDILFILLVPEEAQQEHLNILAGLAQLLSNDEFCRALRESSGAEDLYRAAVELEA